MAYCDNKSISQNTNISIYQDAVSMIEDDEQDEDNMHENTDDSVDYGTCKKTTSSTSAKDGMNNDDNFNNSKVGRMVEVNSPSANAMIAISPVTPARVSEGGNDKSALTTPYHVSFATETKDSKATNSSFKKSGLLMDEDKENDSKLFTAKVSFKSRIKEYEAAASESSVSNTAPYDESTSLQEPTNTEDATEVVEKSPQHHQTKISVTSTPTKSASVTSTPTEPILINQLSPASSHHLTASDKIRDDEIIGLQRQHRNEIDEMLQQLDQLEAEYSNQLQSIQQENAQKDVIVSALGQQLAETQRRTQLMEQEYQSKQMEMESMDIAIRETVEREDQLCATIEEMKREREAEAVQEKIKIRQAVERTERDMRRSAEQQFGEANRVYGKLKGEFDDAMSEVDELKLALQRSEDEARRSKMNESATRADLARLKADLASAEAAILEETQLNTTQLEAFQKREEEMQAQLEQARQECQNAHMGLANVVTEKERILAENRDLQSVCEELMLIVEGAKS
mmetsp:Transcript_35752/g.43060  ORF Transcript_35752/g.43060 Transcript_35752/m.43060 type:complete len:514 (-) Transcript_35752:322-1863(-)